MRHFVVIPYHVRHPAGVRVFPFHEEQPAPAPPFPLPYQDLKGLPTRFTAQDVAQEAGKPLGHVYVYVSRWMKDKKVRKVEGGYQKVSQAV